MKLIAAIFALVIFSSAAPAAGEPTVSVAVSSSVTDTMRALDRLHSYGYTINTPARAARAIRSWQKSNGLTVDGQVGASTLASLSLPATAAVPAVRTSPPEPVPPVAASSDVESIIRSVWPADLADHAVAIAYRESRLQPEVINRNGDATGLFQIMWSVHRSWLCPQLNICAQSDLQDAQTNATAAYALYQRAGGWGPWSLG